MTTIASEERVGEYAPENYTLYSTLLMECQDALNASGDDSNVWVIPAFARLYGRIQTIRYFQEAGLLAPAISVSMGHDIHHLEEALEQGSPSKRRQMILRTLSDLKLLAPTPRPR